MKQFLIQDPVKPKEETTNMESKKMSTNSKTEKSNNKDQKVVPPLIEVN